LGLYESMISFSAFSFSKTIGFNVR